jgi:hypothetical protein
MVEYLQNIFRQPFKTAAPVSFKGETNRGGKLKKYNSPTEKPRRNPGVFVIAEGQVLHVKTISANPVLCL